MGSQEGLNSCPHPLNDAFRFIHPSKSEFRPTRVLQGRLEAARNMENCKVVTKSKKLRQTDTLHRVSDRRLEAARNPEWKIAKWSPNR